jgi:hypothetical protein
VDDDRCNEQFWDLRCEKPRGHTSVHRAERENSRVMWGAQVGTETDGGRHYPAAAPEPSDASS